MMRTASSSSSGAQPPPPAGQQQQGGVAQITYDEAIAALRAMFSHVPQATLEAVLRARKWNMERTVEALLELDSAEPPSPSQPQQPTMPAPSSSASSSSAAGQQPRRRGKPVALPDDFLRVPGRNQHHNNHARTASGEEQLRADEALARQLQQQESAVAGVDGRYQQHRRQRAASLQHQPSASASAQQAQAHARRPRMQSAPGYPPSAGGRAPSPGVEESLEKLGKAIGQAGASVKRRVGDLYARFLNAKGGRHQRMEDDEQDSEVVAFGSNSAGSIPVPPPQSAQAQGPAATAAAARPQQQQQQQQQQDDEEEEELFSRVNRAGTAGGAAGGPQASSTTHRMV